MAQPFATTRWSLILDAARTQSARHDAALSSLCELYWPAVYAFVRRSGKSPDDARDLTQAFFVRVLEKGFFKEADRSRGKFRSFLLASVRNFLANEYDRSAAKKRGGGIEPLRLDFEEEDRRRPIEPPDERDTPEEAYARSWADAVLTAAMRALEARYESSGRRELFERLKPFLTGDEPPSYNELASKIGGTAGQLRVAVHRLRQDYGRALRETIAETVTTRDEVDEELRYLQSVIGNR